MFSHEVTYGQRVTIAESASRPEVRGREFIVFERHPDSGVWWLQCAESGHVNKHWFARPRDMRIVEDTPVLARPVVTLRSGTALVVGQDGLWGFVAGERSGDWQIVHLPSKMRIGSEVRTWTSAKELTAALDEAFPELDTISHENIRDIADVYNRFARF